MAKIVLNPIIDKLHGSIVNFTFRYIYGRQTLMKKPDMSRVKWSEAQQAHRRRFKRAVADAQSALADPEVSARYEAEAAARGMRPFDFAVSDCYKRQKQMTET